MIHVTQSRTGLTIWLTGRPHCPLGPPLTPLTLDCAGAAGGAGRFGPAPGARSRPPETKQELTPLNFSVLLRSLAAAAWEERAPCIREPHLWYSDCPEERQVAVEACGHCGVRDLCRTVGRSGQEFGVWGAEEFNIRTPKRGQPLNAQTKSSPTLS